MIELLRDLEPDPVSRQGIDMHSMKGRVKAILKFLQPVWTECNEFSLRIRTVPSAEVNALTVPEVSSWKGAITDKTKHKDNHAYASPDYWYLRRVISVLDPGPDDVVYDLGCGMGRFLCIVARKRVRRCVGVELFEPLCRKAEENALNLRGRQSQIDILCSDVVTADLSDGTIYFLFNPFGPDTMRDALANIKDTLGANPRGIRIAYFNSSHENILASCGWLEKFHRFDTYSGMPVTFWRNRDPRTAP
jgi:SAM-dependent methyltransferase